MLLVVQSLHIKQFSYSSGAGVLINDGLLKVDVSSPADDTVRQVHQHGVILAFVASVHVDAWILTSQVGIKGLALICDTHMTRIELGNGCSDLFGVNFLALLCQLQLY